MHATLKVTAVAVALAIGSSAFAQTPAPTTQKQAPMTDAQKKERRADWEGKFKAADKNKDNALSKDELAAHPKDFADLRANFDAMDTSKDGKVTMAEHDAWIAKARAAKKK